MKRIISPNYFREYFNQTDSVVAASIAQEHVEEFLKKLIKDPTKNATGEFAEGYRTAIHDLMKELEK